MEPLDDRELDALRQVMIAMSPGLQADIQTMTNIMREMVELERQKRGLDRPGGKLLLEPNPLKKNDNDPDVTGTGWITGRQYRAAGWITKTGKLEISLLPPKRK